MTANTANNGKGSGASHLDKLLAEKPPEFQAKVLRFALDSGMKPEDPAFRLVEYIGYLALLTETAPNEWKLLFENLQAELNEWTQLTAEQLKTQADHTENIKNLATSCNHLGTALSALNLTTQQQLEQLMSLTKLYAHWNTEEQFEKLFSPLVEEMKQIKMMISHQQSHISSADVDSSAKNWARAFMLWLFSPLTFFILFWLYSHFFPLSLPFEATQSYEKILQNVGWTNTKLQRIEKHLGTEPNRQK